MLFLSFSQVDVAVNNVLTLHLVGDGSLQRRRTSIRSENVSQV